MKLKLSLICMYVLIAACSFNLQIIDIESNIPVETDIEGLNEN